MAYWGTINVTINVIYYTCAFLLWQVKLPAVEKVGLYLSLHSWADKQKKFSLKITRFILVKLVKNNNKGVNQF